eukprot:COSAG01_NODE_951_length_12498_cov_30.544018_11_plen_94_part_00
MHPLCCIASLTCHVQTAVHTGSVDQCAGLKCAGLRIVYCLSERMKMRCNPSDEGLTINHPMVNKDFNLSHQVPRMRSRHIYRYRSNDLLRPLQ